MSDELWAGLAIFLMTAVVGYIIQRQRQLSRMYSADGGEDMRQAINHRYKVRVVGIISCVIGVLLYGFLGYGLFYEMGNRFFTYVICFFLLLPCFAVYLFWYGIYAFVVHDLHNRIKGR